MIYQGDIITSTLPAAILAQFVMPSDSNDKDSMKKDWGSKSGSTGAKPVLFTPDEVDIYCNKTTLDAYIFHGKEIDYSSIDHLEYNHKTYGVDVVLKNGALMDLGVKIQWLVRPYFSKAQMVYIVQTKDNQSINGTTVPLVHIGKK